MHNDRLMHPINRVSYFVSGCLVARLFIPVRLGEIGGRFNGGTKVQKVATGCKQGPLLMFSTQWGWCGSIGA